MNGTGYPVNRKRVGAANNFTPALNNVAKKYPKAAGDNSLTLIHKGGLKKKPFVAPNYTGSKSVSKNK